MYIDYVIFQYANGNSNNNYTITVSSQIVKSETKIIPASNGKRKRRPTSKMKKDVKKLPKLNKTEDFDDQQNSRNYLMNNEEEEIDEDQVIIIIVMLQYCTVDCYNGRKYEEGNPMIACDGKLNNDNYRMSELVPPAMCEDDR